MWYAQSGETNRTGRKNIFRSVHFEVQIFQLLRNFLTAKPIKLLSWVTWTFHEDQKIFKKWPPTALSGQKEDRPCTHNILLKKELLSFGLVFACDSFSLAYAVDPIVQSKTVRKWRLIFLPRYFSLTKNSFSDKRRVWMEIRLNANIFRNCLHN